METVSERVEAIRLEKDLSYQKLADLIGKITGDAIRKAIQRDNIKPHYISILSQKLGASKEWILGDSGQIANIEESQIPYERKQPSLTTPDRGVPYYDVDFVGGFMDVENSQTMQPEYYIDFPPYNDVDLWVNITGKSMSPFISHGDIVALKRINAWKDFLLFGFFIVSIDINKKAPDTSEAHWMRDTSHKQIYVLQM